MANGGGGIVEDLYWKDLLGATATWTTICQFLSGMFTVHRIVVKQGGIVGDLSPVPFLMGTVGSALWLIYGFLREDPTVVNCNIVGTVLNAFYVLVFVKYTVIKSLIYRQVMSALVFMSVILLYVHNNLAIHSGLAVATGDVQIKSIPPADSSLLQNVGLICIVIGLLGCASPLVALKDVMRTKSTETLPFPLILSMFLVCSQWYVYGVLTDDGPMQFTNFLGSVISLLQLGLFCVYNSSSSPNKHMNTDYKKMHNTI